MSVQSDPSFGAIFRSVWDGIVKLFRLRFLFLLGGFLVFVAVGRMQSGVAADNTLLREALDALGTILILPVQVAIYRLLILDEASANGWASSAPRFQRMVGWTIVVWVLITLLQYLPGLITTSVGANIIATTAAVMVMVVLMVRLAILFPAIAVDAPGALLNNVWADTGGRTWLILKTALIVSLPLLAIAAVAGSITDQVGVPTRLGTLADSSFEFLVTIMFTVASARLFDWIGHRVKGLPAELGSAPLADPTPSAD